MEAQKASKHTRQDVKLPDLLSSTKRANDGNLKNKYDNSKPDNTSSPVPNINKLLDDDPPLKDYQNFIEERYVNFKEILEKIEKQEQDGFDGFTRSYERFGMNLQPDGSVYCREWCPAAQKLYLWGQFSKS